MAWRASQAAQCVKSQCSRLGFNPWAGKIPWKKKRQPTPGFLPGESHGQRSLVGYSPKGRAKEWLNGKESVCQFRRDRFNPWSGKIPQATEQLSLCAPLLSLFSRAWELQAWSLCTLEAVLPKKRSQCKEEPECYKDEKPPLSLPQLGKARVQQRRPSTAKNKWTNFKNHMKKRSLP